jgi:hypothetical protein
MSLITVNSFLPILFSLSLYKSPSCQTVSKALQQFGFLVNHRTTDSIFILKSLITKYLTKKKSEIFACFVDLRRA